jgi:hypothetical protein
VDTLGLPIEIFKCKLIPLCKTMTNSYPICQLIPGIAGVYCLVILGFTVCSFLILRVPASFLKKTRTQKLKFRPIEDESLWSFGRAPLRLGLKVGKASLVLEVLL